MSEAAVSTLSSSAERVRSRMAGAFPDARVSVADLDLPTIETDPRGWPSAARFLRDDPEMRFDLLVDLLGVDNLRRRGQPTRFELVVHLYSTARDEHVRVKVRLDDEKPELPSVVDVWPAANWFEREAFDLFGIVFEGHPDLRRILTDYGFVGHPFRKDFPLIGNVEVRYDEEQQRVIYEPVTSVEPRVLVPRVIRDDSRYDQPRAEGAAAAEKK